MLKHRLVQALLLAVPATVALWGSVSVVHAAESAGQSPTRRLHQVADGSTGGAQVRREQKIGCGLSHRPLPRAVLPNDA